MQHLLSEADVRLFQAGTHFRLYEKLGAHPATVAGVPGVQFAVWAPNAETVSVIGDFNQWDPARHPLRPRGRLRHLGRLRARGQARAFSTSICVARDYQGYRMEKADPFAFRAETPPKNASVVWSLDYKWGDGAWMHKRARRNALDCADVHLRSARRFVDACARGGKSLANLSRTRPETGCLLPGDGVYACRAAANHGAPVLPSWGYQTTGYFAPTSRYGSPQDFMYLVDYLHQQGIGVFLDWVPSHFPTDAHGLARFDGTHLFEHADPRKGFHPEWKSSIFNYGRHEVRSFLLSSALFWLDKYHVDGLRVDAVTSMLYLNYARKRGEWIPNRHGGHENLEAIEFLRLLNTTIYREHPDVQTIAEESSAWPQVSRPVHTGGLGFGLKWDLGWMHDTLRYSSDTGAQRKFHHAELPFRMVYAFHENFVLPLSHDEVVHRKGSLFGRMPGDEWQRYANLRLLFGYMYAMPGKKLLFMGGEFAQWPEWNHDVSLDWHALNERFHAGSQRWVKDLNHLYQREPALYERDFSPEGFEWVDFSDRANTTLFFLRKASSRSDLILAGFNFTPGAEARLPRRRPPWRLLGGSLERRRRGLRRQRLG